LPILTKVEVPSRHGAHRYENYQQRLPFGFEWNFFKTGWSICVTFRQTRNCFQSLGRIFLIRLLPDFDRRIKKTGKDKKMEIVKEKNDELGKENSPLPARRYGFFSYYSLTFNSLPLRA